MDKRTVLLDAGTVIELRKRKGWSQEELARQARVSVGTIKNLESGQGVFPHTATEVAKVLGVDLQDLLLKLRNDDHTSVIPQLPAPSNGIAIHSHPGLHRNVDAIMSTPTLWDLRRIVGIQTQISKTEFEELKWRTEVPPIVKTKNSEN